jgi:hypothetical protein
MKLIDLLNEIRIQTPSMLLDLIEGNLEYIKKKFYIRKINTIELLSDDPEEVKMNATIGNIQNYEWIDFERVIIFKFLKDLKGGRYFDIESPHGVVRGYTVFTLNGVKVVAIEIE